PHTLAFSKLMLNVFGPMARAPCISATQYHQWLQDVAAFERYLGFDPGGLHGGMAGGRTGGGHGSLRGGGPGGNRELIDDEQLREELRAMESDLIKRMDLREILQDDALAYKITPTLAVVEQLLYDKSNLSGNALKNARALVKKYVDELAEVLKRQVLSSSTGKLDLSQPPKRVFRNLDLKRTLWKNLPNYNPADGRIYVDQLYYRRTSQKQLLNKIIVVVDQSGSMVDAMVQCAILASVFAGLPRVDVSLLAFDTSVIDLTPWVHDPFEALMRTNLGGGNDGPVAFHEAKQHVRDPRRTTMVWISDFYDDRALLGLFKGLKESGVTFIPVGSVSNKGYFNVEGWFRAEFKKMGTPVLTGNIKKLIVELKGQLQ
ncbi:MAG: VWA domain-containing protein, partial [Polyangiaceae bacterium]